MINPSPLAGLRIEVSPYLTTPGCCACDGQTLWVNRAQLYLIQWAEPGPELDYVLRNLQVLPVPGIAVPLGPRGWAMFGPS